MQRRQLVCASAAMGLLGTAGRAAHAQAQAPLSGPASVVSGFPAGGMGDLVSRPLAEKLRGRYAETLILDNRVGAGGRIAAEYVRRAAPDGRTILQIPGSVMELYPHIYARLPYDPLADFAPVTTLCSYKYSFTAGPAVPAEVKTVADYVKWARANPDKSLYGVPALGSALHFAGMMLQRSAGFSFNSVPYRGGAPLLQDLLGGQVPVSFNVLGEVLPSIRSGRLRSLGITSAQRSQFLPEVPTLAEQGYKDIQLQEWLGWFVPARTTPETVRRLNALVREALQTPDMQEALAKAALEPLHQSPEEFAALLKRGHADWAPIVKATGFKAEE